MLGLLGGMALAASAAAQVPGGGTFSPTGGNASPTSGESADPCAGDPNCRQASAAELFAAAETAAGAGDLEGAETILQALTQDPSPELRAEARFRLASVRERRGDLPGAVAALRTLLEEKPDAQRARLELARLLSRQGENEAARRELRQASARGLPPDVAWTVRRYSTALYSLRRRGASVEIVSALDSNVNRSTSDHFVDTVIAPFELDPNARGQRGVGLGLGGEAWSRDSLAGLTLLSRIGAHGDFFVGKGQFDDIQLSLSSGPELQTKIGRFHPSFLYERRWYGGNRYSKGYGGAFNWQIQTSPHGQVQFDLSLVRQSIRPNPQLDGERYAASIAYDHVFNDHWSGRVSVRAAALDAAVLPESLRQGGADLFLAYSFPGGTIFGQAGYTRTEGRAPMLLFGKARREDRFDLAAGIVANRLEYRGFVPLMRILYTNSSANLTLYDYRRARFEIGLTREF